MKRIIITILLSLSCIFANSQEHLMFRGIPIEGNVENFVRKCSKSFGYVESSWYENCVVMNGSFGGETGCNIVAYYTPISKEVHTVAVLFSDESIWSLLEQKYLEYKEALQSKYGAAYYHTEYFDSPYELGDGYEMSALRSGKCHYSSIFEDKNGHIAVKIINLSENGNVFIFYKDLLGNQKKEVEKQELINNSI